MIKRKIILLFCIVFIFAALGAPVQAQNNLQLNDTDDQLVVTPCFSYITIFHTSYDISSSGKASVGVYLTAHDVTSVTVEAYLQQYKNGSWTTIKSWSNTESGTDAGVAGEYYVAHGYQYRFVSRGYVYKSGSLVESTSYTSDSITY